MKVSIDQKKSTILRIRMRIRTKTTTESSFIYLFVINNNKTTKQENPKTETTKNCDK